MSIHFDPSITTLTKALETLYSIPNTQLVYRQHVDLRQITDYSAYVAYFPDHGTIHITFPPQCNMIDRIKNNYGEKMVYYEEKDGFLQEIQITPATVIIATPRTKLIVYHTKRNDVIVSFRMNLVKFRSNL